MSSGGFCSGGDGLGVCPGDGDGGIEQLQAADWSVEVSGGTGPAATVRATGMVPYGPGVVSTTPGASHTTSTLPGAAPTYPTSHVFISYGTAGSPVNLEVGTYRSEFSVLVSGTANNSEYWIDPFINGLSSEVFLHPDFQPIDSQVGKAGSVVSITAVLVVPIFAPIPYWFDLHVAFGGGSGSVKYIAASYGLYKVA
jgi:hypothetical protein